MSVLIRYLLSLAVHLAWQRIGKGKAVPPIRVPVGRGKRGPLPVLSSWQIMAATYVLRRVWSAYGGEIRARLATAKHPAVRSLASKIPDPVAPAKATPQGTLLNKLRRPATNATP